MFLFLIGKQVQQQPNMVVSLPRRFMVRNLIMGIFMVGAEEDIDV
jgi:hypothetical protein